MSADRKALDRKTIFMALVAMKLSFLGTSILLAKEEAKPACSTRFGLQGHCRVSFWSVLGNPASYDGKSLQLIGYFALEKRLPVLYPSREAYQIHDESSAIELFGSYDAIAGAFKKWGNRYVLVTGLFRAGDTSRTSGARIGLLDNSDVYAPIYIDSGVENDVEPLIRLEQLPDTDSGR